MMGKRSNFERRERDFYPTPYEAAVLLLPHLMAEGVEFDEPCAGNGALYKALERNGHTCIVASDIEPRAYGVKKADVLSLQRCFGQMFITNTPWPSVGSRGEPAVSIALHLSNLAPTWLLLSADFAHNGYFQKLESRCRKIVSVGRQKWIPNSKSKGKDNGAWYLFDKPFNICPQPEFYGVPG